MALCNTLLEDSLVLKTRVLHAKCATDFLRTPTIFHLLLTTTTVTGMAAPNPSSTREQASRSQLIAEILHGSGNVRVQDRLTDEDDDSHVMPFDEALNVLQRNVSNHFAAFHTEELDTGRMFLCARVAFALIRIIAEAVHAANASASNASAALEHIFNSFCDPS